MKLTPVFIDFETYWSQTHSLTKINPIVYCRHRDTELISCGVKLGKGRTNVTFGEANIKAMLKSIDWSDKYVIAHNNIGFDAMLAAWRCGVKPAKWGCTLAMSRPLHMLNVGGSLSALVKQYNLGTKDAAVLLKTQGRNLKDFTPAEVKSMGVYNATDVNQCATLFWKFLPQTSRRDLQLIDMTIRELVEPEFEVDSELLIRTLGEERERNKKSLIDLAVQMGLAKGTILEPLIGSPDEATLMEVVNHLSGGVDALAESVRVELASSPKFAARLIGWGVTPPMKMSVVTRKETYAFSRTDQEFLDLQEHDNPLVSAAVKARLNVKSTLLESRINSFLEVSKAMGGKMPIAKTFYAAHTGRWGGSMGLNQENLPRIPRDKTGAIIHKPTNALRMCLRAPKGKKVVVADLSGIELRLNHYFWKTPYSMALWNEDAGADLYRAAGAIEYNCKPENVTKDQRQFEKIKALGLGFGAGAKTFRRVAKTLGGIDITQTDAEAAVTSWRLKHSEIVRGWKKCHAALQAIYNGSRMEIDDWGLCYTSKDGIHTPRGMIRYPNLHQELADEQLEWWYGEGRNRTRIYAGKVTENIIQHLGWIKLGDDAIEIEKQTGLFPKHTVHDELVYLVEDSKAQQHLDIVQAVMRTPPVWWPELVTWSEGDIADSYGEAK
tara:strand:+ start:2610 stop:4601 length:1992 start_codon:yes stop_codon:yes gene_type:complete